MSTPQLSWLIASLLKDLQKGDRAKAWGALMVLMPDRPFKALLKSHLRLLAVLKPTRRPSSHLRRSPPRPEKPGDARVCRCGSPLPHPKRVVGETEAAVLARKKINRHHFRHFWARHAANIFWARTTDPALRRATVRASHEAMRLRREQRWLGLLNPRVISTLGRAEALRGYILEHNRTHRKPQDKIQLVPWFRKGED